MDRATAIHRLTGLERPVLTHMLKCLLKPRSKSKQGWVRELSAWFFTLGSIRLKPNASQLKIQTFKDNNYLDVTPLIIEGMLMDPHMDLYIPKGCTSDADFEALAQKFKPELDAKMFSMVNFILYADKPNLRNISAYLTSIV